MGTLNKFAKSCERIKNESRHMFYKFVPSVVLCYFCENSMIAGTLLVLKDAFANDLQTYKQFLTLVFLLIMR